MKPYPSLTRSELEKLLSELMCEYRRFKDMDLALDMSRGKPCREQLELSAEMLTCQDYTDSRGVDCRNYGNLSGIDEMKEIFSQLLGIPAKNIIVGGNSSLNLMFDTFARAYVKGLAHSTKPWSKYEQVRFLAPTPGYDRHFAVSEYYGMELISIPMTPSGPDMDMVERLVAEDDTIKGIWCVPVYSNPDGIVYSDETVRRLAAMECAAPDFTIIWDNAYCVHHLFGPRPNVPDILSECRKYGHDSRALVFASTSKITFAGGGVSCMAANDGSLSNILNTLRIATISYDKLNQLRHARFLKNRENVLALMERHAEIIRPKFSLVLETLSSTLGGLDIAHWTEPRGGYFISLYAMEGTASRVFELCDQAGVTLTQPGAAFPHGIDPCDRLLRIAPTYPPIEELRVASKLLCLATRIAAAERLLATTDFAKTAC